MLTSISVNKYSNKKVKKKIIAYCFLFFFYLSKNNKILPIKALSIVKYFYFVQKKVL